MLKTENRGNAVFFLEIVFLKNLKLFVTCFLLFVIFATGEWILHFVQEWHLFIFLWYFKKIQKITLPEGALSGLADIRPILRAALFLTFFPPPCRRENRRRTESPFHD